MPAPVVQIINAVDYPQQIRRGADLLSEGKLVVLPTETVYGATAILRSPEARQRLRALRSSSDGKPLTPHLSDRKQAAQFLGAVGELAERMMRKLWPGPVGLQFDVDADHRRQVATQFQAEESDLFDGSSITLRCPDHPVFSQVVGLLDGPVAAAVAGSGAHASAAELADQLNGKVDLIFDAGPSKLNKPSTLVRVGASSYEIVRVGIYDQRIIQRLLKTTILFVCSGNTCRSPMAQALAKKILADRLGVEPADLEKKGVEVISAGTVPTAGMRATPQAVEAVKAFGADLTQHRARHITIELINQADLIFTMTGRHARSITAMVPSAAEKLENLDPDHDIEDPVGGDQELYSSLAAQMLKFLEAKLRNRTLP
jgi:L-threonylcarbamoyladenylate synthase